MKLVAGTLKFFNISKHRGLFLSDIFSLYNFFLYFVSGEANSGHQAMVSVSNAKLFYSAQLLSKGRQAYVARTIKPTPINAAIAHSSALENEISYDFYCSFRL